jgi:hypothetical protein
MEFSIRNKGESRREDDPRRRRRHARHDGQGELLLLGAVALTLRHRLL